MLGFKTRRHYSIALAGGLGAFLALVGLAGCSGGSNAAVLTSGATATVAVTGITLSPSTLSLTVAKSSTLTASVQPGDATDSALTWSSSDTRIANIASGAVTCAAAGSATITASASNGQHGTASVTCVKPFAVYEFLKLKSYQDASGVYTISDSWFRGLGITPLDLIYSSKLVTCPLSSCTDEYIVDSSKIATAAASADRTGSTPVSLDLEVWDTRRFYPSDRQWPEHRAESERSAHGVQGRQPRRQRGPLRGSAAKHLRLERSHHRNL